ncbi:hypothetical protein KGQ90_14925, partial [Modicisalibacter tunisiensis]|uniref:hypothetical protein n=1 Tax=Modicisalibacter tunisiensis TaxID=390637 RepID=UPI001CCD4850
GFQPCALPISPLRRRPGEPALPAAARDTAGEPAMALDAAPWLTPAFARRSLALLAALHRR